MARGQPASRTGPLGSRAARPGGSDQGDQFATSTPCMIRSFVYRSFVPCSDEEHQSAAEYSSPQGLRLHGPSSAALLSSRLMLLIGTWREASRGEQLSSAAGWGREHFMHCESTPDAVSARLASTPLACMPRCTPPDGHTHTHIQRRTHTPRTLQTLSHAGQPHALRKCCLPGHFPRTTSARPTPRAGV